jgi:hypothetical protein
MAPSQPVAGNQLSRTSAADPLIAAKRSMAKAPRLAVATHAAAKATMTLLRMDMLDSENATVAPRTKLASVKSY